MLKRALDDLNEGIRSLLGPGDSRPELVDELLGGRRGRAPAPRARSARRERRPRAASRAHLVLVGTELAGARHVPGGSAPVPTRPW